MWAIAHHDGRPVEYRWRPIPVLNAAMFGSCPLLEYRAITLPIGQTAEHRAMFGWPLVSDVAAVTLPRPEPRWNLQGCPKLPNRYQPLVGRSAPYYQDMQWRYCCLTNLFPIVDTCLCCENMTRQFCVMVPQWQFLRPVFPSSRVQHI